MLHESGIAGEAESRDIGHHVIGAVWSKACETSILQSGNEVVAARGIFRREVVIVVWGHGKGQHPGLLQGGGGAHREKVVDLANRVGEIGRSQHPTYPPARHGASFTHAVD